MRPEEKSTEAIEAKLGVGVQKRRGRRWWLWLIVLLIGAGGAWYYFAYSREVALAFETQKISRGDMVITVSATGNLEPTNTVEVGIEVSGTITALYADYNDRVKKAQVLARLDTTKLESQVRNSHAALMVAQANLAEANVSIADAKNELERAMKMFNATKGKYPSDKEMDALRIAYDRAKAVYDGSYAQIEQAKARLGADEDDLRKAVVVSPIDGIVLERKIDAGQTVAASMQTPVLFTLAEDLSKMEVIVSVDEADVGLVEEGQKVTFGVDAYPKERFSGVITQLRMNSVITDGVVTYEAVVEVDNTALKLRPGMTVSADIIIMEFKDVLKIPNAALRFKAPEKLTAALAKLKKGSSALWVLRNGRPERISVEVSQSDGTFSLLETPALAEGDEVIVKVKGAGQWPKRP